MIDTWIILDILKWSAENTVRSEKEITNFSTTRPGLAFVLFLGFCTLICSLCHIRFVLFSSLLLLQYSGPAEQEQVHVGVSAFLLRSKHNLFDKNKATNVTNFYYDVFVKFYVGISFCFDDLSKVALSHKVTNPNTKKPIKMFILNHFRVSRVNAKK